MIGAQDFHALFELSVDSQYLLTTNGFIKKVNQTAHERLGYSKAEMLGKHIGNFVLLDLAAITGDSPNKIQKHEFFTCESTEIRKDGVLLSVEVCSRVLELNSQKVIISAVRDISGRKQIECALKESEEKYRSLFEESFDGLFVTTPTGEITDINRKGILMFGYDSKDEMLRLDLEKDVYVYPPDRNKILSMVHANGFAEYEVIVKKKNGEQITSWCSLTAVANKEGLITSYRGIIQDITEKKKSEYLIWQQANFDTLTGLPNRNMFRDCLNREMQKSEREGYLLALLLIDLDQFKEVNDTLGHVVGDLLLQEAAYRIQACIRGSDTVARLGGDEFMVLLSGIDEAGHVERIAQKIVSKLTEPFQLGSEVAYVSASIGITLYPKDSTDIDSLIKNADQAMYVAKGKGRNQFSYFTQSLQVMAQSRLRMINDLRGALNAKQFCLHFQPIVEISTGLIHKAEALIRWRHPELGMISPAEFIPLAEETSLIHEIGDWVFKETAKWAKFWGNLYLDENCQLSVNMSPVQFQHGSRTCENWVKFLADLGLSGNNMVVEITEGLLLNAESTVTDTLLNFRDAGLQVAIDDFGTGYSSLSYLNKFDIDYLKIDRSFVSNLETDANNMALSEAIIVMAHKLGLKVIAEGVETEGQRSLLSEFGCDYAQGYLFSKPVSPEEFEELLNSQVELSQR